MKEIKRLKIMSMLEVQQTWNYDVTEVILRFFLLPRVEITRM